MRICHQLDTEHFSGVFLPSEFACTRFVNLILILEMSIKLYLPAEQLGRCFHYLCAVWNNVLLTRSGVLPQLCGAELHAKPPSGWTIPTMFSFSNISPILRTVFLFLNASHFVLHSSHWTAVALFLWHLIPKRCVDWEAQNAPRQLWAAEENATRVTDLCALLSERIHQLNCTALLCWSTFLKRQNALIEENTFRGQNPIWDASNSSPSCCTLVYQQHVY